MSDREEDAFRNALRGLVSDDEVDPVVARRSVAVTQVVMALALVVLLSGVFVLPRVLGGGTQAGSTAGSGAEAQPASAPAEDSAPRTAETAGAEADDSGWRTEYYRDISFQVPSEWGYAVPPQSDWCADEPQGEPRPDQRSPYVWLRMDFPIRTIGCPEPRPDSLITEHVEAVAPGPAEDYVEGAYQVGEWWVVTRFVGSAIVIVTTKDRELAERIVDSAQVADESAPCPAVSPVAGRIGTRPEEAAALDDASSPEWVAVCQYEPVADQADVALPRLRAASVRQGAGAQDLVEQLRTGPELGTACDPGPVDGRPDIAILVRIATGDRVREVYVAATGCPDGDSGMAGGVDDGSTVRVLTRPACEALLQPPVTLFSASADVAAACLR